MRSIAGRHHGLIHASHTGFGLYRRILKFLGLVTALFGLLPLVDAQRQVTYPRKPKGDTTLRGLGISPKLSTNNAAPFDCRRAALRQAHRQTTTISLLRFRRS